MQRHVQDLVSIDRDTLGERWEEPHFLAAFPGKWEYSRLAVDGIGNPVGFAVASVKGNDIHINRLAVDAAYRGKHLGVILLRSVAETARERSVDRMTLKVATSNTRAIAFYRRLGFTEAGHTSENLTLAISVTDVMAATAGQDLRS